MPSAADSRRAAHSEQGQPSKTITDEIEALEGRAESCEGGEVERLHTLPAVQAWSEPQEETARSRPR